MNLSKYLEFSRVSFRESFAYRVDAFSSIFSSSIFLLLYFYVWSAIIASGHVNSSLHRIMTYFVIGQVVGNTVFVNVERYLGEKIRKGTIVNELKRPVTVFSQAYFHELGNLMFNFIARALPVGLLGLFFLQISLPGLFSSLLFLLSLFLAFNLVFLFSYSASMLIFWTKVEWSIRGSRNRIQKIFAGTLFPLFLVPERFQIFFNVLPFRYMVDGPITIFTGSSLNASLQIIQIQIVWIGLLLILAHFSWKKAKTKLTVQGG